MTLQNKTIFITGATAGFGLACAKLFVAEGARVIATGRREDRLAELKRKIENSPTLNGIKDDIRMSSFNHSASPASGGGNKKLPPFTGGDQEGGIHTIVLDVRSRESVEKAIASLPPAFSNVDILINNAGLALGLNSYEAQKIDEIEQMIETNILGVLYCTHALLPGMIQRNLGHIVNMGSIAGSYPYPGGNVYGATKAFLEQFTLNLKADLIGKNVRVTNIEPGMAETEFSLVRFHGDTKQAESVYENTEPLTAQDIAETILWCITRPAHVNINRVELMAVQQGFSPFAVSRKSS